MGFFDLLKRHKRKFFIAGTVVGGAFALGKFVQWKLAEYSDQLLAEEMARARKKHHYDSNQRTCRMTALTLLPSLRESLFNALNTESLTTKLKSSPENKILTWRELKTTTFSRFMASVYSYCLLVTFLRVQLNILGGYMYHGEVQDGDDVFHISTDVHKQYLAAVQYFLGPGLSRLIELVQAKVQAGIGGISLKEKVTVSDVEGMISEMRRSIEVESSGSTSSEAAETVRSVHPLITFLLPEEGSERSDESSGVSADAEEYVRQLMAHTRDVLESRDFKSTLLSCLDCAFQFGLAGLDENMLSPSADSSETRIPLARVVPIINAHSHSLFAHQGEGLVSALMTLEMLNQFSANVYEAYSHETSFQ